MVFEKIKKIIEDQFHVKDITMTTSIRDDLTSDSLDLVEFVMELEDVFNLEVEDEDLEAIETVGDAVKIIESKLN